MVLEQVYHGNYNASISECAVTQCDCMGQPALNKLLQYTCQCANLERNYNENAQNINCASILINPEIQGLAEP